MFVISNYVIDTSKLVKIRELSKGGYGTIFLVKNKENQELYAAKILGEVSKPGQETKFFREIEILLTANHPSIVKCYGFSLTGFSDHPSPTIFTEYMENNSLFDRFLDSQEDPNLILSNTQKQIILLGIAKGMEYLHQKNIFHRDLKPGNVLLDENLYPKICDFGLSKHTKNLRDRHQSIVCGTPFYMAPEVHLGKYDCSADVYSYGVLVSELLANTLPNDDSDYSIIEMIPPDTPPAIHELIESCMSNEPQKRPTFTDIIVIILNNFLSNIDMDEFFKYANYLNSFNIPQMTSSQSLSLPTSSQSNCQSSSYQSSAVTSQSNYEIALKYEEEKNYIKAARYMQKAADTRNTDAMYRFALMLKEGNGVVQDIEKAKELLLYAADDNHKDAQFELAKLLGGDDLPQSAKYMKLAADNGHARAQYLFSEMLREGFGIIKDEDKSLLYLKKAADNNEPDAEYEYAKKIQENDPEDAERYLQLSADNGNSNAQFEYGTLLFDKKDKKLNTKAAEYIKMSADQENPEGQNAYGICLRDGKGVKKCIKDAINYFQLASKKLPAAMYNYGLEFERKKQTAQANKMIKQAADNKYAPAAEHYAQMMYANDEISEAAKYYQIAADAGIANAQFEIANMLIDGNGITQDVSKAKKYLKKAAEQNHHNAAYLYAKYLEESHKWKESAKYYKLAADNGNVNAIEFYAKMQLSGKCGKKNIEEALKYYKLGSEKNSENCKVQYAVLTHDKEFLKKIAEKNSDAMYEYALMIDNNEESLKYLKEAARNSNVDANYELGRIYKFAEKGVKRNIAESNHYFKTAADLGSPKAQAEMGFIFYNGSVFCNKDPQTAAKYFKLAADNGNDIGQLNYALMLLNREYTFFDELEETSPSYSSQNSQNSQANNEIDSSQYDLNASRAVKYLQMAADQHMPQAQYHLAKQLMCGEGISVDMNKAEHYLKLSADKNYIPSVYQYALLQKNTHHNYKAAAKYMKKAANSNDVYAQVQYAKMLLNGEGVEKNEKLANEFLTKAAKMNCEEAISLLKKNPNNDIDFDLPSMKRPPT
ncbi:hypothetical protein TRFO_18063 [Tritrichomonas foetus]|uniref:Protein kinase domain-containing protein n=1 Tax=Tritrichomonas foetus TaxID=1144522 RepID=A0A1J4KRG1_9EUKA|nr:hypothetical protein TRFO_18063 [Tritrichomonas foetus]|eukprot:OHT12254.1 hypothetical protein TRFO_18063 [Tritrichomonas foetus]